MYENICNDHHSSVLCSLDMQFNKHAAVLLHGLEAWNVEKCRLLIYLFTRKTAFPMLPWWYKSFKTMRKSHRFQSWGLEGHDRQILGWGSLGLAGCRGRVVKCYCMLSCTWYVRKWWLLKRN